MSKTIKKTVLGFITCLLVCMLCTITAFAQEGDIQELTAPEAAVSAHTAQSATLVWTTQQAEEISGYEISSYSDDEYTVIGNVSADQSSYTATGLTSGNIYKFAVRSFYENEIGEKTFSEYSNIVETAATPAAPSIKSITRSATSLTVSFSNPNASHYQIRYSKKSDMSGATTASLSKTRTKITISNLTSATRYYVQMRSAVTLSSGERIYGAWSAKSNQITKPKKMTISSITTPSTKSIKASWSTVTATKYQLQYSTKSDFSSKKTVELAKNVKTKTISNLTTGKIYYVRIRAYITSGSTKIYGDWSAVKKQKVYTSKKLVTAASVMQSNNFASKTLYKLKKGASVRYISTSGRWVKVMYSGKTGYVYNLGFKKAGSQNLYRANVTAKNYKIFLDDIIFSTGKNRKALFNYVCNHMSYSYSKISKAQRNANINSLAKVEKNEAELAAVAIKNRGGICYNYAAHVKTLLERAGFNVQYIYGSNKNGSHCWVITKTTEGYRHLDAVRKAYLFTDKQMHSSSKTKDFKWNAAKYPACK